MVRTSDALWKREQIETHVVRATPETVQWGRRRLPGTGAAHPFRGAVLIECLAHHAGDAPDLMFDDGVTA
jgi:hypothetical protein